jgi:hypothetical protein
MAKITGFTMMKTVSTLSHLLVSESNAAPTNNRATAISTHHLAKGLRLPQWSRW